MIIAKLEVVLSVDREEMPVVIDRLYSVMLQRYSPKSIRSIKIEVEGYD